MKRWMAGWAIVMMLALPIGALAVDKPEAIGFVGVRAGEALPDGAQAAVDEVTRAGETRGNSYDFTALGGDRLFVELSTEAGDRRLIELTLADGGWTVTLQSAVFPAIGGIAAQIDFWSREEFAVTYDGAELYRQYRFRYEEHSPSKKRYFKSIQPRWALTEYEVRNGFDQPGRTDRGYLFETYPNGVMCRGTREGYADHRLANYFPYGLPRDAETVDVARLPLDRDALAAALYDGEYAIVHNPVESDRLHLRTRPEKGAESLGKFYNGTVAYILGYEGDWAHVCVGGFEGYMMREYLAVGAERANAATFYYTYYATPYDIPALKAAGAGLVHGWPDAEPGPMLLYARPEKGLIVAEIPFHSEVLLLGVYESDWVIVEYQGAVGYAYAENVWEGNG